MSSDKQWIHLVVFMACRPFTPLGNPEMRNAPPTPPECKGREGDSQEVPDHSVYPSMEFPPHGLSVPGSVIPRLLHMQDSRPPVPNPRLVVESLDLTPDSATLEGNRGKREACVSEPEVVDVEIPQEIYKAPQYGLRAYLNGNHVAVYYDGYMSVETLQELIEVAGRYGFDRLIESEGKYLAFG